MTAYMLPITSRGVVRLSVPLRETHLDKSVDGTDVLTQAIGDGVRVWIASDNDDIRLDVQTEEWLAERPYEKRIHRWGINLGRYHDSLVIDVEQEKPHVEAAVEPVEVCYGP